MIRLKTLENGLRVILDRRSQRRSVSISIWVKSGRRDEPDRSGASHFLEHVLFLGSEKYPTPYEIARPIEKVGGSIGAASGCETTVYYAAIPHQDCRMALDILLDMLLHPKFDQARFDNEKKVIISEIEMYNEESFRYLNEILVPEQLWGRHPLGGSGLGDETSIRGLTIDTLKAYHSVYYNPQNAVISIAGRFDENEVLETIEEAWGGMTPRPCPSRVLFRSRQTEPDVRFGRKDIQQSFLTISLRTPPYSSTEVPRLELINLYLAGGMSSALFEEVRNQRGLAYDISSELQLLEDCGVLYISAETDPGKAAETFDVIANSLSRKAELGFTADEVEELKSMYIGGLQMRLEDLSFKSSWMASQLLRMNKTVDFAGERRKIRRITPVGLDRLLGMLLSPENWNVHFLGPNGCFEIEVPAFRKAV